MPAECYDAIPISQSKYFLDVLDTNTQAPSIVLGDSDIMLALDPRVLGANWYSFARGGSDLEREYLIHNNLINRKFDKVIFGFNLDLVFYLNSSVVTHFDEELLTGFAGIKELFEMTIRSVFFSFYDAMAIRDSFTRLLLGFFNDFFISVNYLDNIVTKKTIFQLPSFSNSSLTCSQKDYVDNEYNGYIKTQGYRDVAHKNDSIPNKDIDQARNYIDEESLNFRKYILEPMLTNLAKKSQCVLITVPPKMKAGFTKGYEKSVKNYIEYLKPITDKLKNVKFLKTRWFYDYLDFQDSHHMNSIGAKTYTQNLKESIEKSDCS